MANIVKYLDLEISDGTPIPTPILKFKTMAWRYRQINDFSSEESKYLIALSEDPKFRKIIEQEVSFLVMVAEFIRLYIEEVPKDKRVQMNISDNKLKGGFRDYVKGMLVLKQVDPIKYKDKREIMDNTRTMAREFFWFLLINTKGKDL